MHRPSGRTRCISGLPLPLWICGRIALVATGRGLSASCHDDEGVVATAAMNCGPPFTHFTEILKSTFLHFLPITCLTVILINIPVRSAGGGLHGLNGQMQSQIPLAGFRYPLPTTHYHLPTMPQTAGFPASVAHHLVSRG